MQLIAVTFVPITLIFQIFFGQKPCFTGMVDYITNELKIWFCVYV